VRNTVLATESFDLNLQSRIPFRTSRSSVWRGSPSPRQIFSVFSPAFFFKRLHSEKTAAYLLLKEMPRRKAGERNIVEITITISF
jgi:hypothetical protein